MHRFRQAGRRGRPGLTLTGQGGQRIQRNPPCKIGPQELHMSGLQFALQEFPEIRPQGGICHAQLKTLAVNADIPQTCRGYGQENNIHGCGFDLQARGGAEGFQHMSGQRLRMALKKIDAPGQHQDGSKKDAHQHAGRKTQ